jgi:hypothetical protein
MDHHRKSACLLGLVFACAAFATAAHAQNYDPYYGRDDYRYDARNGDAYREADERYGARLRCESRDRRTEYCGVDTRGGVRLVRQLSDRRCVRGSTWGADGRGIWVTDGCRAEFELGADSRTAGLFRCESKDNRTRYCDADTRHGVQLVRQLSRDACIEGRSWGMTGNSVWVSRGCRAEFARGDGSYRGDRVDYRY